MNTTIFADANHRPRLLDRLDLALLRLAKHGRVPCHDVSTFYESFFVDRDVDQYLHDARAVWRFRVMRAAFDEVCREDRCRVADVGCGLAVSRLFLPSSISFVGVDPSARTLATARRIHGDELDIRRGGFPRLPIEDGWASFAVCQEVLEHVGDDFEAIAELGRILCPYGHLLLSVPRTFYWPQYRALIGHYRHYNAGTLDDLLQQGGFRVVRRYPQLISLWRLYHYAYVGGRGFEVLVRRIDPAFSLYRSRVFRWVSDRMLGWACRRSADSDPWSTMVLCRKVTK